MTVSIASDGAYSYGQTSSLAAPPPSSEYYTTATTTGASVPSAQHQFKQHLVALLGIEARHAISKA
jgi:hypothetical protein